MKLSKRIWPVLVLAQLSSLWLAWEWENFALLLLAVAIFSCIVAYRFKVFRTALTPVVTLFVCLSLAEVLLSVFMSPVTYYTEVLSEGEFTQRIEGFRSLPISGIHRVRKRREDGEVIYDAVYSIGEDGYRKSPSTEDFDAYVYGGSYTFGEGLNDDETLVHFLWLDHDLHVKSISAPGHGMQQALYKIEHGFSSLDEWNILLTAPWHSFRSACKRDYSIGTPKYKIVNNFAVLNGVCNEFFDKNRYLHTILDRSEIYKLVIRVLPNNPNELSNDDIELYLAIIRSIARETRQNRSRLAIAFIRSENELLADVTWSNDSIMQELKTIADIVVDVTLAEKPEELDRRFQIHELDPHPSAEANRVRAGLIATAIKDRGGGIKCACPRLSLS